MNQQDGCLAPADLVRLLRQLIQTDGINDTFDAVLLASCTGMRVWELATLEWRDICLEHDVVYVRSKKHPRGRFVALPSRLRNMLLSRPKTHRRVFGARSFHVLRNSQRVLKLAGEACGIPKLRFHDLRRYFVRRTLENLAKSRYRSV
jgi:integrase